MAVSLVLASTSLWAADLDAVTSRLSTEPLVTGEFVQRREVASLPFPLMSTGEFVLLRDEGLYWHVLTPAESELRIRDGEVQERIGGDAAAWTSPPLGRQGNRMTASLLTDLLAGRFLALDRLFELAVESGEAAWTVRLTPRSAAYARFVRTIEVEGGRHVRRVRLSHDDGESTTIELETEAPRELTPRERGILE